jgi:hypothetical protein
MQDHCRRSFIPKSPTHLAVRRLATLADRPATCLDGRFDQALTHATGWLSDMPPDTAGGLPKHKNIH